MRYTTISTSIMPPHLPKLHHRSKSSHTAHGKYYLIVLSWSTVNAKLIFIWRLIYQTKYKLHTHSLIHHIDFWKHFSERPLDTIFHPHSVALIGASEKEGSVGRTILWNLLSSPFGGTIYPVNNRIKSNGNIFGIRSYTNVTDVPERGIDLVIIAVPARAVKEVSVWGDMKVIICM